MTKMDEIKDAVSRLSPDELAKFRAWFDELEEQLFDEKIARDEKAGKLDKLAEHARENLRAGRVRDL